MGLAEDDYPRVVAGDIPGVYPYIVDGVGEGIQAKRRGLAVIVDHLTPPLQHTPLYDQLLQLRQLAADFAELVAANGLPGSGHTEPSYLMLPWLEDYLAAGQWQQLQQQLALAKQPEIDTQEVHRLTELQLPDQAQAANDSAPQGVKSQQ